jgi:hypothetical protein
MLFSIVFIPAGQQVLLLVSSVFAVLLSPSCFQV